MDAALQEDLQRHGSAEAESMSRVRVPRVDEESEFSRVVQVDVELFVPIEDDRSRAYHRARLVDAVKLDDAVKVPEYRLGRLQAVSRVQTDVHQTFDAPLLYDPSFHVLHVWMVETEVVRANL